MRRHVDVEDRDLVLGVRVPDDAVGRRGVAQLVDRALLREPSVRILRRDLRHRRQQFGHPLAVVVGRDAEAGAPRDVEDGERQPRLEHVVGDLRRVERRFERERIGLFGLERPGDALARLLGLALGLQSFRTGDDRQVHLAVGDRRGGVVYQHLRGGAAHARVEAVTRRDAERVSETVDGRVVRPRHAMHDLQRVDRCQYVTGGARVLPRRGAPCPPTAPTVRATGLLRDAPCAAPRR